MGCCLTFNDKYQECELLIEELKIIILHASLNKYTENELEAIRKFIYEKEEKIRIFILELEKNPNDEFQKRKIQKLKNDFNEILDEDNDEYDYESNEDYH